MNTLTAQDVLDIRDRYAAWEHPADLAQHYGVSASVIYGIAQGRLWADVTGGKPLPKRTRPDPNLRLNAQHVRPVQARPRTTGTGVGTRDPQTPRRVKPRVKLTAQDVLDIQDRHAAGEGTGALARRYAVSNQAIYSILRGHTWGRVTGMQPQKPQQPQKPKLTANAALDIYTRYAAGESSTVLAREYQVSRMTVNNIARGEHWGAVTGGVSLIKNGSMPNARLTPETVRQLRERARQGAPVPLATLAAEYGVSPSAVGSILRWDTWKDATPDLPAPHLTHVRGRKPALNPSQRTDIRQASQQGRTPADLAAEYGVHVSIIRRALKEVL